MDKGKIVRLGLIPVIIGLVVTLIVRQVLTPAKAATGEGPQVEMVKVVVIGTKEPVPARTKIGEQHLTLKDVPKSILTGSEFAATADVVGQVSNVALEPGEVVLKSRVVPEGKGTLAYRVPQGMRAITIRIDELSGVAGNANPGDRVDLVLVLQENKPDRPFATARMIYEGVEVLAKGLAAGAEEPAGGAPGEPAKLTSLTLAMRPEHAVEVALAEQIGLIKFMLRPAENKESDKGRLQYSEQSYK
ncbi:MAG: Flp pilus assembly protein CpaB [Symbiobacteriaceae bacterium]|jgi:pilus assembly protein CpaB|nr:Flp pilus assembly protein CpaB [Symbiobacteriaceae bacterium]